MKTLYAACLSRLGLSQTEAASLHGVRIDTIKKWSAGTNPTPPGAWQDLRQVEARIIDRSEALREAWQDAGEIRAIDAKWNGDRQNLMAIADFMLSTDTDPPVTVTLTD